MSSEPGFDRGSGSGFDRDVAVREWRTSILSRGGLTVGEVDELQDHLELVEADMLEQLRPHEAFWLAAHRVGTPDALTREFAKVRPNMGWEVRAQWVLLGLAAYMLLVPAMQLVVYLLVALLATVPQLVGLAAGIRLYATPLAILLLFSGVAALVRRSGASPNVVDRAVGRFTASGWLGMGLAVLALVAWRTGLEFLSRPVFLMVQEALEVPGGVAPIQSEVWFWLANGLYSVLPLLILGLVVRIQRRLERARPARA